MWEKTLRAVTQRPYIGWGYRSFTEAVVQPGAKASIGGVEYSRPHNDYLHTAQELGIPVVIFIGGFFGMLWKKFRARQNKDRLTYILAASALIALINMSGQTFIRYASVAGTFIILLAFLAIKIEGGKDAYTITVKE